MKAIFLLLMVAAVSLAAATEEKILERQSAIARTLAALPVESSMVFLYSLDPKGVRGGDAVNTDRTFRGFTILGKAKIEKPEDKRALFEAFAKGVMESDGGSMACFNPRHGIRVMIGSSVCDFVICFESQSVRAYGFNEDQGFTTAISPRDSFDHFLDTFHLKRAKQEANQTPEPTAPSGRGSS